MQFRDFLFPTHFEFIICLCPTILHNTSEASAISGFIQYFMTYFVVIAGYQSAEGIRD
ncbi:MAG: hypothetical protein EZS28_040980, partial [Streblomastix strix]